MTTDKIMVSLMRQRRLAIWTAFVLTTLALASCTGTSSNIGKYYQGRTLHLNVVAIERLPELRYATIDPEQVVRNWRLVPSSKDLELVMLRLKVENHTAISAVLDVDQQAAQLRDMLRETYFPIDLPGRVFQDLRGQTAADVHIKYGQCFDPNQMYITPGTKVTWVNDDEQVQYVDLTAGGGDSHAIGPGETYSRIFDEPGTWDYDCGAEGPTGQAARIVVEEEGDRPPPAVRSVVFVYGPFELQKDMGIDGWMVFEAPEGARFRDFRWQAGDSVTITF